MPGGVISLDQFKRIEDQNMRLEILFSTVMEMRDSLEVKLEEIKKGRWFKLQAFIGGIVGGSIAVVTGGFFGK